MTKHMSVAFLIAALVAALTPAAAQEQLRAFILDRIGPTSLDRDGYGCFDPLAALRFDEDVIGGEIRGATEDAFAVGACVVLESNTTLEGAQRISIKNQTFVRGAVAGGNLTAYLPDWSASLAGVAGGYDEALMGIAAPMRQVATALHARVAAYQECSRDGEELESRIADYNERAEAIDPKSKSTGSRLVGGGGAAPVYQVILPDERFRELFEEAQALQAQVETHEQQCADFRDGVTLDMDYLDFVDAMG